MESAARQWVSPQKTCLIAATPRCGSTLLGSAMYASGVLGRPYEFFNFVATDALHPGAGESLTEQLAWTVWDGVTPNGVLAIKLMPYQFERFLSELSINVFPNRYWIFVRRRNLLDQAISREIAMQTDAWFWMVTPKQDPIYSADKIESQIETLIQEEQGWLEYFERESVTPLTLWYNEIASSPKAAARRIANHLEVPWPTWLERARTRLQRRALNERYDFSDTRSQSTELNRTWRAQFAADRPKALRELARNCRLDS